MERIVLGRAGRNTKVYLEDVKADNGADAVIKFIKAKKWGWDRPAYKKLSDKVIAVSEWAMGQVIGPRGFIVKNIAKAYGYVKIVPLRKEEDSTYKYVYAAVDYTRGYNIEVLDVEPKYYRMVSSKTTSGVKSFYRDEKGVELGGVDYLIINEEAEPYTRLEKKEYLIDDYFKYIGKVDLESIPDDAWVLHSEFGGVWCNTTLVQIAPFTELEEELILPLFVRGKKSRWKEFKEKVKE